MVDEILPAEVEEQLGEVQIIDIRPREQFKRGHIPGAVNIPMGELPQRIDDHDWDDEVVVACPIGQSSVQAARLIESYEAVDDDARIASMAGGYEEWKSDLETGTEEET
jgi:rhodanese-related sulfurtransferase